MGFFSKLKDALFSKSRRNGQSAGRTAPPKVAPESTGGIPPSETAPPVEPVEPVRMTSEDLTAQLNKMSSDHPEKLDWRKSIVDLMKLVDMDSGFAARKGMALELGYSQEDIDSKGSADMNIWLHKAVMKKLSEDLDGELDMK